LAIRPPAEQMSGWQHSVEETKGLRISLLWLLLGGAVAILLGALTAAALRGDVDVVVSKRAIPPFTKVAAADLEQRSVGGAGFGGSATKVADLAGKFTTEAVEAGARLEASDVLTLPGGRAPRFRFQIHPERAEALGFEPGEEVRLWFSPTEEGDGTARICARLLAVPDTDSAAEQTYIVAVGAKQARVLVAHLGRSRLLLSRPG
jgi:hypothetical protein